MTSRQTKKNESTRKISVFNDTDGLKFSVTDIRSMFHALDCSKFCISDGELSIALLGTDSMCAIHEKFLGDDTLTDVLTFPGDNGMDFAGEICVSPDYAAGNCECHGTTFSEELSLYLVHGYLHIFGLDDTCAMEMAKMRDGENFCMALIKGTNRLPKFSYERLWDCKIP